MEARIRQLIAQHGLEAHTEEVLRSLRPGIGLSKAGLFEVENAATARLGLSRFGGLSDVPRGFHYPHWHGKPLGFLCQINCSDLAQYDANHVLPHEGMLYFFYDIEEQPWGYDPQHRGGSAVIYLPNPRLFDRSPLLEDGRPEKVCLQEYGMAFKVIPCLPSPYEETCFDRTRFTQTELEDYFNLLDAIRQEWKPNEPLHQLLGHSYNLQGDMQLECQLTSHGLYCGDSTGYQEPRAENLKAGAAEWQLLLQFDTDEDLGVMWGDTGLIFFWIRESDLRKRQFDRAWTVLQCC